MTVLNTMLGPIQISRTAFGNKGLTFKKPPSWAVTKQPASEAQAKQWVHLAISAHGGQYLIKGTVQYKGSKGMMKIPAIAAWVGFQRLAADNSKSDAFKVAAFNLLKNVTKNRTLVAADGKEVSFGQDGIPDADAWNLVLAIPVSPPSVTKSEAEIIAAKKASFGAFMKAYEKIAKEVMGGAAPKTRASAKAAWYDDSDIGTFF